MSLPLPYGNPVGQILGNAMQAYEFGTAIRRQPEIEANQREDRDWTRKQRATQSELDDIQLTEARKKQNFDASQKQYAGALNDLHAGLLDPNNPDDVMRLYKAGIGANVNMNDLGTPRMDANLAIAHKAIATGDLQSPQTAQAATALMPYVNLGADDGETKSFHKFMPGNQQGTLFASLHVDKDGERTQAPLTLNRSSGERDPVQPMPLASIISHVHSNADLNEAAKTDPRFQAFVAKIQSIPEADRKQWTEDTLKGVMAANQGKEYDPEDDRLKKRGERAKVAGEEQSVETAKARAEEFKGRSDWMKRRYAGGPRALKQERYIATLPDGTTQDFDPDDDDPADLPAGSQITKLGTQPGRGGRVGLDPAEEMRRRAYNQGQKNYDADRKQWKEREPAPGTPRHDAWLKQEPNLSDHISKAKADLNSVGAQPAAAGGADKATAPIQTKLSGGMGTHDKPVPVSNASEWESLPSGTSYHHPDDPPDKFRVKK